MKIMKRIYLYSVPLMSLLLTAACNRVGQQQGESETVGDTLAVKMEYQDTIQKCPVSCLMEGGIPKTDNKQLKRIMNEWINETFGGVYLIRDTQNTDSILAYYQKAWADSSAASIKQFVTEDYQCAYTWENRFKIEAETDKYVTLSISSYTYQGGAHGSSVISQQTFRKEDGREMNWNNMFNMENQYKLREMIKSELMKYFKVNSDEDFANCLLNPDDAFLLPLPQTPPVLLKDGIHLVYQQYEIAPYACGMPEFTLPYSKVKPLLTTTASQLIE